MVEQAAPLIYKVERLSRLLVSQQMQCNGYSGQEGRCHDSTSIPSMTVTVLW